MAEVALPTDTGFAEFVGQLLREVYEGIVTGQLDEEVRVRELVATAQQDVDEFARRHVDDERVDAFFRENFPRENDVGHAVVEGASYVPAEKDTPEEPPYEQTLGVGLSRSDYVGRRGGPSELKASAVQKLTAAARRHLAQTHLQGLRDLVERGVPRLIVEAARVKAKMTFQLMRLADAEQPEVKSRFTVPLRALRAPSTLYATQLLSTSRVVVRQADDKAPSQRLDVYGEVEVTYKTIV